MTIDITYLADFTKEQQRYQLFTPEHERDKEIKHYFAGTVIDTCKMLNGSSTTSLHRIIMENFIKSLSTNVTCPFPKNFRLLSTNCTYTDKFFPLIPTLFKFRIVNDVYGIIKGQKKFTRLYLQEFFTNIQKSV
jgi:Protein of unknown function (DUF1091)